MYMQHISHIHEVYIAANVWHTC